MADQSNDQHPEPAARPPADSADAASLYLRFADDELILRDELAIDRTLLANERTVLAYLRSAVALVLAGVSIMHFAHEGWFRAIGIVSVPAGLFVGVFGVRRYRRMDRGISVIRRRSQARADRQRPAGRGAP